MANIWEYVQFKPSERPRYTRFELAKLVREKRTQSNFSINELVTQFGGDTKLWESIENATRSFNVHMYKLISAFLCIPMEELTAKEVDNMEAISFRANDTNAEITEAIEIANLIFDEMVMQEKFGAN